MQNENPLNYMIIDEEKPVQYRELFEKYSYHWKWFILGIAIALTATVIYLRYTPQQYAVSSTILIEDEMGGSLPSELSAFEDLGLSGGSKKKVETEIGLLKSRTLMERTVKALDITTTYSTKGRVREVELYKYTSPVNILFKSKDSLFHTLDTVFSIKVISKSDFILKNSTGVEKGQHRLYYTFL